MNINEFSKVHSIQPEALKSWIQEKMYRSQHPESESNDIFQASEFVELDILARKNFLFCGSEDGARSTCLLFSLIECAIINDINPEEYLSSIFELAADTTGWTDSKWSELLPWNIK